MKLRALNDTYYEGPRKKGDEFEADDVNGRVLVELVKSCEKVDDMQTRAMKAEDPQPADNPQPQQPQPQAGPMTTESAEALMPKKREYKRRDMRSEK
jgi:hypothetical protein